jgi:propionyl-CoA synthetase
MAATLQSLGVKKGDRVLVYMPMIPEAAFAMLACARIGAIHSVVFGGFASVSLASRIDDAEPTVIVSADAGSRGGKVVAYKPLLDEAIKLAAHKPAKVLMVNRGLAPSSRVAGRDEDYASWRDQHLNTSGALRVGRRHAPQLHAVHQRHHRQAQGRAARHRRLRGGAGRQHEAHLHGQRRRDLLQHQRHRLGGGPQLHHLRPADRRHGHHHVRRPAHPARRRHLVEPGREVQGHRDVQRPHRRARAEEAGPGGLKKHDLSSLRALFLAGEPLDEPTAQWIADSLGKPIIDNYWQTETGWPILAICNGVEQAPTKFGSPGKAVYGYDVKLLDETTGEELTGANQKGVVAIEGPLPPGCMQTVWRDDARFVNTYWKSIPASRCTAPSTGASATPTATSSSSGRTDDVINVAGHRLGTREIEESISSHPNVAEVAVVGVADQLKGQVAMAFAVLKDPSRPPRRPTR